MNCRLTIINLFFLDMLTVNETANEPPPEDGTMDSAKNLGMEAVFINHNFAQQVLKTVYLVLLNKLRKFIY